MSFYHVFSSVNQYSCRGKSAFLENASAFVSLFKIIYHDSFRVFLAFLSTIIVIRIKLYIQLLFDFFVAWLPASSMQIFSGCLFDKKLK